jgi:catechol 2,3-dioxygenase-like lactoylglutathione lyase family enzyme
VPQLRKTVPVLRVIDLSRSADFYTRILGFELQWRTPDDGDGEMAMLAAGDVALLLSTGSHLGDIPRFTGTLYFDMQGMTEFYEQIKDQVELIWPLEKMDYGQTEFGLRDPDGYTLAFAEGDRELG